MATRTARCAVPHAHVLCGFALDCCHITRAARGPKTLISVLIVEARTALLKGSDLRAIKTSFHYLK